MRYRLQSLIAMVTICVLFVSSPTLANAMGDSPDSCQNRYDGEFTTFTVANSTGSYDITIHPNMTINVYSNNTYDVNFVMHMPAISSQDNSDFGTTWYHETASGYANGHCTGTVGPNGNIGQSQTFAQPPSESGDYIQHVEYATVNSLDTPLSYNIHWINNNPISNTIILPIITPIPIPISPP